MISNWNDPLHGLNTNNSVWLSGFLFILQISRQIELRQYPTLNERLQRLYPTLNWRLHRFTVSYTALHYTLDIPSSFTALGQLLFDVATIFSSCFTASIWCFHDHSHFFHSFRTALVRCFNDLSQLFYSLTIGLFGLSSSRHLQHDCSTLTKLKYFCINNGDQFFSIWNQHKCLS